MSELLYLLGEIDHRVRPLIFCVRQWAISKGIIQPYPTLSISNFGLTCLVIFFLQQLSQPILPSVQHLNSVAGDSDKRQHEAGQVQFVRNFSATKFRTENCDSLSILLLEFFKFYARLDFNRHGVSTHTGRLIDRLQPVMHVVNPIVPALNVTRNIGVEDRKKMQLKMQKAARLLESEIEGKKDKNKEDWGILPLVSH